MLLNQISLQFFIQTGSKMKLICVISSFRRDVEKNCTFLGDYTASSGNFLPTFQDNLLSILEPLRWNR